MHIQRLELFRFRPFLMNGVELLEVDTPSDIQNIIGSNGAGKSSLLGELNPKPATRTDFGDGGYKRIWLSHNGSDYVLGSNFINLKSPHSFVKDEVELNESGTTGVQDELVANELGYTNLVHTVVYGDCKLSEMPIGARKTFLLTIHPCQMKMIFDKHRNLTKRLNACRDQLSMLHERRAALTVQMIDDTLKQELLIENDRLTQELGLIVQAIGQMSNQRKMLVQNLSAHTGDYTIRTRSERNMAKQHYPTFQHIPRNIPTETCHNTTVVELGILATKIDAVVEQARSLTLEIDKYEHHIRQNDAQGAIDVVEAAVSALRLDVIELEKFVVEVPFDHFIVDSIPDHISRLTDLIAFFIGYNAPIPAMRDVVTLQTKLDRDRRQLEYTTRDVEALAERSRKIETNLITSVIENIPDGCQGCVLFKQYSGTVSRIQGEYDAISHSLQQTKRRQNQLTLLVEGRMEKLALYNQAVPQLQQLSDYLNEYRFLLGPLKDLDLLTTLRRNPSILVVRLERHYQQSQNYYKLQQKKAELSKLSADYEKLQTPSEFGRAFLETMVTEKHAELQVLQRTHQQLQHSQKTQIEFLACLTAYEKELILLQREATAIDRQLTYETLSFERTLCDRYLAHLEQSKQKTVSRLTDIDQVLREQDALSARYHQEVLVNIDRITQQAHDYAEVEKALSPILGIPDRYMVQFINDLIHDANTFLQEVFSYPFEFIPIAEGHSFDYKFPMRVCDVPIPDIADGSMAQKAMAELAFTISLMIQLELTKYPLYLDECDKEFDVYHKQRLLQFLKSITEDTVISQLFTINHNAVMYGGMGGSDTIVLNEANIAVPPVYNEHVYMERY